MTDRAFRRTANLEATVLFILRHAEPRRGESDPELTSFGHQMAREAAGWVVQHLPSNGMVHLLHTPTARTRQTAEALEEWLGTRATIRCVDALPETISDLDVLTDRIAGTRAGLEPPPLPPMVLVGHHTTLVALARALATTGPQIHPHHHAAGVLLERCPEAAIGWRARAVWPGRPGNP